MRKSDPFFVSVSGATGSTGPEAFPKLTIVPRFRSESSDASKVLLPTESYATWHPWPSVISATRRAMSSVR